MSEPENSLSLAISEIIIDELLENVDIEARMTKILAVMP